MIDLPESIRGCLPDALVAQAEQWWRELSDSNREEVQRLCDARKETFLFESFPMDGSGVTVAGGKFLAHDDCIGIDEWGDDYMDYLMGNPELVLVHDPAHRTFHIGCTRHLDALQCYSDGRIPADFKCPFASTECRMKAMGAQKPAVGLRPLRNRKPHNVGD